MARIYNQEQYGDQFQPRQQSRGFNPVQAADATSKEREKAQQAARDLETEYKSLTRQQSLDTGILRAQQGIQTARQQANNATLKGLLSLSSTALKGMQVAADYQQEQAEVDMTLDTLGFGAEPGIAQEVVDTSNDIDTQVSSEAAAIGTVARDVNDGTVGGASVAHQLQQGSAYQSLQGINGNILNARGVHGAFLEEAVASLPADMKPTTVAEAQQLVRDLNRKFFSGSGLSGANRSMIAKKLGPTMINNTTNMVSRLVKEGIKADQAANLNTVKSNIYKAVASDASGAEVWQVASEGYAFGNVGNNGYSAAGNETALKEIIKYAEETGDTDLIDSLEATPKMADQPNGPTLGDEYAHLLGPAREKASDNARTEYREGVTDRGFEVDRAITSYYDNPTPEAKASLVDQLAGINHPKARAELERLTGDGFANDPQVEIDLVRRAANGDPPSQAELKDLLDKGIIRESVYKNFAKSNQDIKNEAKVDEFTKQLKPSIKAILQGNVPSTTINASPSFKAKYEMRAAMMREELNSLMAAEVRSNPALLSDTVELQKLADQKMQQLATRPEYQMDVSANGVRFKADPGATDLGKLTIAPGEQDFSQNDPARVLATVPRSEMNASKDIFLSPEVLNNDVNQVLKGLKPGPQTAAYARSLGLSERAFIDAQLKRYNKPSLQSLQRGQDAGKAPAAGTDLNADTGYQYIRNELGFPTRGTAYLTSAISHESTWHGTREWGQVKGDGTNRNGGLISWASWHDNSARLGAIERHFGRNISQISETDQLQYMQHEMKTSYKDAYRIFMNPNASSADLQWAVSRYWGFDPRYTGNRWVDAERIIRQRG